MENSELLREMPHSDDAEQAILGSLILENEKWEKIEALIQIEDFYRERHRIIFNAMTVLIKKNDPLDIITISEVLKKENTLSKIGGSQYLYTLIKNIPNIKNIIVYIQIIKNKSLLRNLIVFSKKIIDTSLSISDDKIGNLINKVEKDILTITEKYNEKKDDVLIDTSYILSNTIRNIELLFESGSPIIGLPSGFKELDYITTGFHSSDFIIIAGRPSMGKTTFAINIAENIIKSNIPVLMFSMEMPSEQIMTKLLASTGEIKLQNLRNGMIEDTDWPKLSSAVFDISGKKLFIDDSGSLSPFEVKNKVQRLYKKHKNLGLIIIDYLQLMKIPGMHDNKVNEMSEISRSLKLLAKELKIPIIALSQLNRSLEQRIDKRPIMSDLRESGAIEQDADLILFIYRDEIYNKNMDNTGIAEIIIAKQRNGPTGKINLKFLGQFSKFESFNV